MLVSYSVAIWQSMENRLRGQEMSGTSLVTKQSKYCIQPESRIFIPENKNTDIWVECQICFAVWMWDVEEYSKNQKKHAGIHK